MRLIWKRIAAIAVTLTLTGCSDLTRSEAERILDGEARGSACQSRLDFNEGGFAKAKTIGAFSVIGNDLFGTTLKVADAPNGDQWICLDLAGRCGSVSRKKQNLCLTGKVEILAIADAPFAPNSGSYKVVEFVEVVTIPQELERIGPYLNTRYKKHVVFQKTDAGWRVTR
jgi:hypothetical protein